MLPALTAAPALFLFLGAWPRLLGSLPRPFRAAVPVLAATLAGASAAWLGVAVWLSGEPAILPLSPWAGSVFETGPALEVDVLTALCLFLVSLCALVAQLRALGETDRPDAGLGGEDGTSGAMSTAALSTPFGPPTATLLVPAAAALFVAGTRAPLGLALTWVLLDLALAGPAKGGRRTLLGGQLGLFLALAGLTGAGRAYLVAAGVVRAGLYPVSWSLPRSDKAHPWRSLGLRLPVTVAGLHLAFVAGEGLRLGAGLDRPTLIAGMTAVLFGAVLSYLARDGAEGLDWAMTSQAGLVLLALGLNDPFGRAIAVALLLAVVLSAAVRYAVAGLGRQPRARVARALAWAAVVGLPPTLGFSARWLLYDVLLVRGQSTSLVALAVAVTAAVLLAAPAAARWLPPPPARRAVGGLASVVLLLAGLELALGLGFPLVSNLARATGASSMPHPLAVLGSSLGVLARAETRTGAFGTVGDVLLRLALIGLAPLVGFGLRRLFLRSEGQIASGGFALSKAFSLTPLFDGLLRLTLRFGEMAQVRSGLVEGRRAMATTLLGAILIGVALLGPLPATTMPDWPVGITWLLVIGAVAISSALLLLRARLWTLLAVVVAHLLSGLHLALSGAPIFVGLVQLLVGFLAAGMLAISVMQAPIDRRLVAAARRLRELQAKGALGPGHERTQWSERLVLMLSLAVLTGIALGMPAPSSVGPLLGAELAPAIILLAGGLLTVLYARSALHLSAGVLVALAGFEAIYGLLDAGLLVTGVQAVVQLLFAVIASAFVGSSPTVVVGGGQDEEKPLAKPSGSDDLQPEIP